MKEVVTDILTNTDSRSDEAVESVLMQQATAVPWANEAV